MSYQISQEDIVQAYRILIRDRINHLEELCEGITTNSNFMKAIADYNTILEKAKGKIPEIEMERYDAEVNTLMERHY